MKGERKIALNNNLNKCNKHLILNKLKMLEKFERDLEQAFDETKLKSFKHCLIEQEET